MKSNSTDQWDFITPLAQFLVDVAVGIFRFSVSYFKGPSPFPKKIDRSIICSTKQTKNTLAIGLNLANKKDFFLREINFQKHSFIVGASGFGKTNLISILQEHSLNQDKPIIFFDPKGDLDTLTQFKQLCLSYNKSCFIFSEYYPESIALNPFKDGSVNNIVERIMNSYIWENEYYKSCCKSKLYEVLLELERQGLPCSLKHIFDLYKERCDSDSRNLLTRLESIIYSDFAKVFGGDDGLTFSQIRKSKACLYIGLSTQGHGETAYAIGKILLGELLYHSYQSLKTSSRESIKNPIAVYFDEFGSLVTNEFIELQNKCRGAGIELTLAVQSIADIDKIAPDLTKQIVENAGNLFVMKQRVQASAEFFSEAIGTIVSEKRTEKVIDGEKDGMASVREAHELLVHPDIIKNLGIGQCIFLGQGPVKLALLNIRERKPLATTGLKTELNIQPLENKTQEEKKAF